MKEKFKNTLLPIINILWGLLMGSLFFLEIGELFFDLFAYIPSKVNQIGLWRYLIPHAVFSFLCLLQLIKVVTRLFKSLKK